MTGEFHQKGGYTVIGYGKNGPRRQLNSNPL